MPNHTLNFPWLVATPNLCSLAHAHAFPHTHHTHSLPRNERDFAKWGSGLGKRKLVFFPVSIVPIHTFKKKIQRPCPFWFQFFHIKNKTKILTKKKKKKKKKLPNVPSPLHYLFTLRGISFQLLTSRKWLGRLFTFWNVFWDNYTLPLWTMTLFSIFPKLSSCTTPIRLNCTYFTSSFHISVIKDGIVKHVIIIWHMGPPEQLSLTNKLKTPKAHYHCYTLIGNPTKFWHSRWLIWEVPRCLFHWCLPLRPIGFLQLFISLISFY